MSLSNIDLIQSADQDTNQLQVNIKKCLNQFIINPLLGGNMMMTTLAVGDNQIPHGLNAPLQGWLIADINGISSIYRSNTVNPTQILTLNSSAAVHVTLYVF